MCGILNIIDKKKRPLDRNACGRALAKLYMRGPDFNFSYFPHDHIFLGQTVLSLVGEPKENDNSYLWSKTKKYYISFNGEIYNYKELHHKFLKEKIHLDEKSTDTEILVNLFEDLKKSDVPLELDGMYAFSIYDPKEKMLLIARDFQGEKTLYIYENHDYIIISSQVDAILEFTGDLEINKSVLQDYFHTRHFLQIERHCFKGIRQLRPGMMERLDLTNFNWEKICERTPFDLVSETQYYKNSKLSFQDLTSELESLLKASVKEMIPEKRAFGSVISGGIDSSLLTSYACQLGNPHLLIGVNHIGKDEISNQLNLFEKKLKRSISILDVDWLTYTAEIARCQKILSSPLLSHSFIGQSLQSAEVRRKGCKALYGGEGADELFGGYTSYKINGPTEYNPSPYSGYFESPLKLHRDTQENLRNELKTSWKHAQNAYEFLANKDEAGVLSQMICDLYHQISSVAMRGADLMSLMWGIETRSIFMRRDIVKFAVNLPLKYKIDLEHVNPNMRHKRILKELFVKQFGQEFIFPKQGFAGFPNESKRILGEINDFVVFDFLNIDRNQSLSRDMEWKLINTEHFLRGLRIGK